MSETSVMKSVKPCIDNSNQAENGNTVSKFSCNWKNYSVILKQQASVVVTEIK